MNKDGGRARVPEPGTPVRSDDLPHALTFFLTKAQRRAVLRALGRHGRDRAVALLRALGLDERG